MLHLESAVLCIRLRYVVSSHDISEVSGELITPIFTEPSLGNFNRELRRPRYSVMGWGEEGLSVFTFAGCDLLFSEHVKSLMKL